ncbi:MFS-type transporter SLC18B1-like [Bolinopsis microptera]|uniref:MFS-type transporter SLC18B1-like n=1 Tax=Bolinopsis microptera TaxID=2820187 RepID=UPI00307981C3
MFYDEQPEQNNEIQKAGKSDKWKKALFAFCFLTITTQYFFFTMPLAFLVNELIEVWKHNKITSGSIVGAFSFSLAGAALLSNRFTRCIQPRQTLLLTVIVLTLSAPIFFVKFDKTAFVIVLFITRMIQGFVIGLCEPQLMSVMTSLYPERLGFVTGSFELAASISSTVGPLLGGFIYQNHGFAVASTIPCVFNLFASIGGLILLSPSVMYDQPDSDSEDSQPTRTDQERTTIASLFILPVVLLGMFSETLVSMIVNTIESFYPNFYSVIFNKQEGYVGAVLAIAGLMYCIATVTAGMLVDKEVPRKTMIFSGMAMMICGCLAIDQEFIKSSAVWAAIMLSVIDFGSGLTQISILPCLIVQYQYITHVSRETSSCQMSGLFRAAYFTGAFFGPVIGGFMLEFMSYQNAYIVLAGVLLANLAILAAVELIFPHTIEIPSDRQGSYENLDSVNSD